jgi:galactokinase
MDEFCKKVGERYRKITGMNADFYLPEIGDGVRRLMID